MASLPSSPANVFPDAALVTTESLADLPSLGSLGHFAGLCSRCCFHAKGRCQNGHDCRFCHFEHEKRQRKKKVTGKYVDGSCNVSFPGPVAPKASAQEKSCWEVRGWQLQCFVSRTCGTKSTSARKKLLGSTWMAAAMFRFQDLWHQKHQRQ